MRLIDADALLNRMTKAMESGSNLNGTFHLYIEHAPTIQRPTWEWIPVSERLPSAEDCPMDCMVTRKSKFIGNYVDMAVAEANGTWTHEDWDAIVLGDVESGRKTGLMNTHDHPILAWMPLPEPYEGGDSK